MPRFLTTLVRFKRDEKGVTAVEYGLIASVIITALSTLGTTLSTEFISLARQLSTANAAAK